jgi:hypothetical protein
MLVNPDHELDCIRTDEEIDPSEIQLVTTFHQSGLTAYEQYLGATKWFAAHPGATAKELCHKIDMDAGWMTRLMSLDKCCQRVKEAAGAGQLGLSHWYAISKAATEDAQLMLLESIRAGGKGATRDAIETQRKRNGTGQTVRLPKVRVPLPHGASVVVSGAHIGMMDLCELLSEVLKEARKAAEQYDVKTWVRMMADKARGA